MTKEVEVCPAPQVPLTGRPLHLLPDAEFLDSVRRYNGIPQEVDDPDLLALLLPLLRADFAVFETFSYRDRSPLTCPISVFGGIEDALVSRDQLEKWRMQTACDFTLRMIPGDHFFLQHRRPILLQAVLQDVRMHMTH